MCPKTYIVLLCVVLRALHCMVRCVDDKVFHGVFFCGVVKVIKYDKVMWLK